MNCFPCFSFSVRGHALRDDVRKLQNPLPHARHNAGVKSAEKSKQKTKADDAKKANIGNGNIDAQAFTFRELAAATENFRPEFLLGEGGFGRVYKGCLENSQFVAIKQLDRNGLQGNREFLVEVLMLSLLHHENLVNLIGYCADGIQRLLVHEFMPLGSLDDHLLEVAPDKKALDWYTRMKIATGAARGLEYLHDKANPPVIYRDLKSSNILLDEKFNPKLSDFGLAKLGPDGDRLHVSSRVMGTYGYCAPEYARTGQLTLKSDVYSFGVVLLELITGKRAIDTTRPNNEQNLVTWAQPIFKDPKRFPELADPLLKGGFPVKALNQAVAVAAMCLQEEASVRPLIADVVTALSFLSIAPATETTSRGVTPIKPPTDPAPLEEKSHDRDDHRRKLAEESARERQRAVAEAKEWESSSRGTRSDRSGESSSGSDANWSGSGGESDQEENAGGIHAKKATENDNL